MVQAPSGPQPPSSPPTTTPPPATPPTSTAPPADGRPVITFGGAGFARVGQTWKRAGRFSDSVGTRWLATVNYGDGATTQRLALSADKRFALKHVYRRPGTYRVTVWVRSSTGQLGRTRVEWTVRR